MSNIVKTIVPISLDNLKLYFVDKSTAYLIDYKNSKLQGQKLLIYLGNLDLNCDLEVTDPRDPDFLDLLKVYFETSTLVNVPALERAAIQVLLEYKKIALDNIFGDFIVNNIELVTQWTNKLDSLVLFNTFVINDEAAKDEVRSFPEDDTDSIDGINWVSLLKHEHFYFFYQNLNPENLKYYSRYFNDTMFKGRNLYSFWATEKNPLFLITWGILEQKINSKEWVTLLSQAEQEIKEKQDAASV